MLTRYILHIGENSRELVSADIRNWDQIQCAFSRKDYNGVVRSFSSKFEFVGEVADLLRNQYLLLGVKAEARLTIETITDRWEWVSRFEASLDFSTVTWDNNVLSISAIDDSLASLIKARQNTKYELSIGDDIVPDVPLEYDRLKMLNSVTHEVMSSVETEENDGISDKGWILLKEYKDQIYGPVVHSVPVYVVGDGETYENSPVSFDDQTEEPGTSFLTIEKSGADVTVEIDLQFNPRLTKGQYAKLEDLEIYLKKFTSDINPCVYSQGSVLQKLISYQEGSSMTYKGCFPDLETLKKSFPEPSSGWFAVIGKSNKQEDVEALYMTPFTNADRVEWMSGEISLIGNRGNMTVVCDTRRYIYKFTLSNLSAGDKLGLFYRCVNKVPTNLGFDFPEEQSFALKSDISTKWYSRAKPITIDTLSPRKVAQTLLDRIVDKKINVDVTISGHDSRIAKTVILAAESIRGIEGAKFYSSFKEFCEWMQVVFGYTYRIGEYQPSDYVGTETIHGVSSLADFEELDEENSCPAANVADSPVYLENIDVFAVYNNSNGKYYSEWPDHSFGKGSYAYNKDGVSRKDKVYVKEISEVAYYIDSTGAHLYAGDPEMCTKGIQNIHFLHREELYGGQSNISIENCRELSFSINSGLLYSTIEIGYDKQDYDAECGRDEWNFNNSYTTGIDVSDKTLSMKSKYRADCYGIEFLAQKRSQDSKDDKSDKGVFFVHCKKSLSTRGEEDDDDLSGIYMREIDRSVEIARALSDTVFNGEYSPGRCLLANAKFIAAMGVPTELKFASSEGNSDITIGGVPCSSDYTLASALFTCGEVTFKTDYVEIPEDPEALFRITNQGITYSGFLDSVTLRYARPEAAKYKLIVKEIEI